MRKTKLKVFNAWLKYLKSCRKISNPSYFPLELEYYTKIAFMRGYKEGYKNAKYDYGYTTATRHNR
jgi:hypothetical protein